MSPSKYQRGTRRSYLALEAQKARLYALSIPLERKLYLNEGKVSRARPPMKVRRELGRHYEMGEEEVLDLARHGRGAHAPGSALRYAYITAPISRTYPPQDPGGGMIRPMCRNAPEKLFVTHFEGVMPPTLITADVEEVKAFRRAHNDIIVKPI